MRNRVLAALICLLLCPFTASAKESEECVVLLHGLARTTWAMSTLEQAFQQQDFAVVNLGYPSREKSIEELAPLAVETGVAGCPTNSTVHFVTHSLGGILLRYYVANHESDFAIGRVVMIAPPNQGSEVVDNLRDVPGYTLFNGPAGRQLGTGADSIPRTLGPVTFETGIIAGTRSINLFLSQFLPNPDDGKVSVESTRVEGMSDFITLPHSHPFILEAEDAIQQALYFIQHGRFDRTASDVDAQTPELI
jgi:hypothetical protein